MARIDAEPPTGAEDLAEIRAMMTRQLDSHADLREQIGALKGEAQHFATKEDVANVKVWALTSIGGAAFSILSITVGAALVLIRVLAD